MRETTSSRMESTRVLERQVLSAVTLTLLFNCISSAQGMPDDALDYIDPYAVDVPLDRFPYMCTLRHNGIRDHACGGVLVHPRWVLTAAHCIDTRTRSSVGLSPVVYCGTRGIDEDNSHLTFITVDYRMHESWNGKTRDGYDIALLKLDREALLTLPRLNTVGNAPSRDRSLAAMGWGRTADAKRADILQLTRRLRQVSYEDCAELWKETVKIQKDIMICAKGAGADTCDGDSGGPLFVPDSPGRNLTAGRPKLDIVFGFISFGPADCINDTRPAVYTDVGYFKKWIETVISLKGVRSKEDMLEEVIDAIKKDDAVKVERIIQEGLDPDSRSSTSDVLILGKNGTLLHWTALFNAVKSAQVLIKYDADLEAKGTWGDPPLHFCVDRNSSQVAQVLLDAGADVNSKDDYESTALHDAARREDVVMCKILLRYGADVAAVSRYGNTPLHDAAQCARTEAVRILLEAGASKTLVDDNGNRPVDEICQGFLVECTEAEEQTLVDLLTP